MKRPRLDGGNRGKGREVSRFRAFFVVNYDFFFYCYYYTLASFSVL